MRFLAYIYMFFPSFIHVNLRRLCGQRIGKGTRIKFGTLLLSSSVTIGKKSKLGPFCLIRANQLKIGDHSTIKSLSIVSTRVVEIGNYVHIAPLSMIRGEFTKNSKIEIGDHSRIFPYCWIDTGEGVIIGKNVGIGGHTLIFTHGVWPDYVDGGPISFGPVKIHDNVWLPWRIFILPNVEIGENSIIAANSLVNKSFAKNSLIGGSPAKLIKENYISGVTAEQKIKRFIEIFSAFSEYIEFKHGIKSTVQDNQLIFPSFKMVIDKHNNTHKGDLLILLNESYTQNIKEFGQKQKISILVHAEKSIFLSGRNKIIIEFIPFIRRYGIRLYEH